MNKAYIFLLYILMFMACTDSHNNRIYNNLVKADSLLMKELPDSAYKELLTIGCPAENDRENRAYYALLMTQSRYLLYMNTDSSINVNYAIKYYKERGDNDKLARALHWKAELLCEKERYIEAIETEKEAEANVEITKEPLLGFRIHNNIAWLNNQIGNYIIAKEHALSALHLAERLKDKGRIAESYYRISCSYNVLKQVDSALYHIERALPFINYTKSLKNSIIHHAALCYRNTRQWAKAEEYVRKGMEIEPSAEFESLLGDIYIQTGRADEGVAILQRVLPELEGSDKWQSMQLIEDVMMKQGRHVEAAKLQEEIMLLKDSINKEKKTAEALAVQKEYERKVKADKARIDNEPSWQQYVAVGGACTLLAALLFWTWYRFYMKRKNTEAMNAIKKDNERKAEEIACLNEKLGKDRERIAKAVMHGKVLYNKLINKEKHIIKDNTDYADIVEYYRTINPTFILAKEMMYEGLTPYNLCILIMSEALGMDDDTICQICNINNGALRTQKSRINKKHK